MGEGESFAVFLKNVRLDLPDELTKIHKRRLLFPLPEGEGQGEGKRGALTAPVHRRKRKLLRK